MRKTANISYTEAQYAFAQNLVESGEYASLSEIAREGMRLLMEKRTMFSKAQLRKLIEAWDEAEASGPDEPLEPVEERIARFRRQRAAKHEQ